MWPEVIPNSHQPPHSWQPGSSGGREKGLKTALRGRGQWGSPALPLCGHPLIYAVGPQLTALRAMTVQALLWLPCPGKLPWTEFLGLQPCSWPAATACQTSSLLQVTVGMGTDSPHPFPLLGYYIFL